MKEGMRTVYANAMQHFLVKTSFYRILGVFYIASGVWGALVFEHPDWKLQNPTVQHTDAHPIHYCVVKFKSLQTNSDNRNLEAWGGTWQQHV